MNFDADAPMGKMPDESVDESKWGTDSLSAPLADEVVSRCVPMPDILVSNS